MTTAHIEFIGKRMIINGTCFWAYPFTRAEELHWMIRAFDDGVPFRVLATYYPMSRYKFRRIRLALQSGVSNHGGHQRRGKALQAYHSRNREIKMLSAMGLAHQVIADKYNLTRQGVYWICTHAS